MLPREKAAVCAESHTKHNKALCGQNVEILTFNLVVQEVKPGSEKLTGLLQ
jgi:hypothetical protein